MANGYKRSPVRVKDAFSVFLRISSFVHSYANADFGCEILIQSCLSIKHSFALQFCDVAMTH